MTPKEMASGDTGALAPARRRAAPHAADGKPLRSKPSGEMVSPHAGRRAILAQAIFHCGHDIIGKCNLRIGRFQTRKLRCLRPLSDPGFEQIELMLEIREGFFQISQFFRAGISIYGMLPIRCSKRAGESASASEVKQNGLPHLAEGRARRSAGYPWCRRARARS